MKNRGMAVALAAAAAAVSGFAQAQPNNRTPRPAPYAYEQPAFGYAPPATWNGFIQPGYNELYPETQRGYRRWVPREVRQSGSGEANQFVRDAWVATHPGQAKAWEEYQRDMSAMGSPG